MYNHEKPDIVLTWLWPTAFMPISRRDWGGWFMKERPRDFLRGQTKACLNHRPLVRLEESFDPEGVWDIFSIKVSPFSSLPPASTLFKFPGSVYFWESCQSKVRQWESEKQQKPSGSPERPEFPLCGAGPRSDTLTLLPDVKRSFYHNRIMSPPLLLPRFCLSVSLECLWTQTTWATLVWIFFLFFSYFTWFFLNLQNHLMR